MEDNKLSFFNTTCFGVIKSDYCKTYAFVESIKNIPYDEYKIYEKNNILSNVEDILLCFQNTNGQCFPSWTKYFRLK